jgi:proteasome lid subunit RPN8/RPN11
MVAQARAELPNECCGLLGGVFEEASPGGERVGKVVRRYPLVNAAASGRLFESDPRSMFEADRDMRRNNLEVLAVYHSHPTSAPLPSKTDLERNYSPAVVNLIISLQGTEPAMRGWWLTEHDSREAEWRVV